MAIKYEELHKEKTAATLTEQDIAVLNALDAYTDHAIKDGYGNNADLSVVLDSGEIDKIVGRLPYLRIKVVQDAWVDVFKKAGWEITHTSVKSQEKTAGRKGKVKKVKRESAEWIVRPASSAL